MPTVLSTKILSLSQKELVLNSGLGLVDYNALKIEYIEFPIPEEKEQLIFTSQNAVKSYTKIRTLEKHSKINVFCVGEKTKALLNEHGFTVLESAKNALELAEIIVKKHNEKSFVFLSGNKRRDELPMTLKKNNVRYKEILVYRTEIVPKQFETRFDGVLFFSPSTVESFTKKNSLKETPAFCVGDTTAEEAKKYTDKIIIARKPTIENVIVQAVRHFDSRPDYRQAGSREWLN